MGMPVPESIKMAQKLAFGRMLRAFFVSVSEE